MSKWLTNEHFIAPLDSYTEEEIEWFLNQGCWIEEGTWLEAYKSLGNKGKDASMVG